MPILYKTASATCFGTRKNSRFNIRNDASALAGPRASPSAGLHLERRRKTVVPRTAGAQRLYERVAIRLMVNICGQPAGECLYLRWMTGLAGHFPVGLGRTNSSPLVVSNLRQSDINKQLDARDETTIVGRQEEAPPWRSRRTCPCARFGTCPTR